MLLSVDCDEIDYVVINTCYDTFSLVLTFLQKKKYLPLLYITNWCHNGGVVIDLKDRILEVVIVDQHYVQVK